MPGSFVMPFRKDDGRGCNADPDCDGVAVLQANVEDLPVCADCGPVSNTARGHRAALLSEADRHGAIIVNIEAEVRSRGERGEDPRATPDETAAYLIARTSMTAALHEARQLESTISAHDEPHTHPVFACETHAPQVGG